MFAAMRLNQKTNSSGFRSCGIPSNALQNTSAKLSLEVTGLDGSITLDGNQTVALKTDLINSGARKKTIISMVRK